MSETASPIRPQVPRAAVGLVAFGLVALAVAAVGGLAASSAATDYAALKQPSWAPSPAVFGPVWAVLYAAIAVSGWLVWRRSGFTGTAAAMTAYGVQLVLNALWTPLFFGADLFGLAFAEITALALAIVTTIVLFARHSRLAAALLVPYLAWVGFAATLNFAIWQLNP